MKFLYPIFVVIFAFIPPFLFSQTAVSINNGNWTNPLTWDCNCIPISTYSVTIHHNVILDTNLILPSGYGLNIDTNASLIQDTVETRELTVSGLYNSGNVSIHSLTIINLLSFNSGTLNLNKLNNFNSFSNSGTLSVDSIRSTDEFRNVASGILTVDTIINYGLFDNYGHLFAIWIRNDLTFRNYNYHQSQSILNNGVYQNEDTLLLSGSVWNYGGFVNAGFSEIGNDFINYPSSNLQVNSYGNSMIVLGNWSNAGDCSILTADYLIVSHQTENTGNISYDGHFCDLTPPPNPPFIDVNTGSISTAIQWCTSLGLDPIIENDLTMFPNPSNGNVFFKSISKDFLIIKDSFGKQVYQTELNENNNYSSSTTNLNDGVYFLFLKSTSQVRKLIVTH